MSLGLLVYGDNHLVLRGPRPDREGAFALARHFGLSFASIRPLADRSGTFEQWTISTREFRENLAWAAVLPAATLHSPAIRQLLDELTARGMVIDLFKENSCAV